MSAMDIDAGSGAVLTMKERQIESLPWVEKYRPKSMDDLIAHEDIISTIGKFIEENKMPHLLLYGPPGTGKTSTILACARKMYGNNLGSMVLELNASDDRGIDVVRDQIKDFASTRKIFGGSDEVKLIILDEADQMTNAAQFALRRVIEKYTKNVRFCILCNNVGKIIPALQSRCTRFRFSPLKRDQMVDRVQMVIKSEGISVTEEGLNSILRLSLGDMRKSLNILQAVSMAFSEVTEGAVYHTTGQPMPADIERIVDLLMNATFEDGFNQIDKLKVAKGLALQDILQEIVGFVVRLGLPNAVVTHLLTKLADVEYRLAFATDERLQLASVVGIFRQATQKVTEACG